MRGLTIGNINHGCNQLSIYSKELRELPAIFFRTEVVDSCWVRSIVIQDAASCVAWPRRAAGSLTFFSLHGHQGEHEAKGGRGSAGTPPSCQELLRRAACPPTPSEVLSGEQYTSEGEGTSTGGNGKRLLRLLRRRVCQRLPQHPALGRPRVGARS